MDSSTTITRIASDADVADATPAPGARRSTTMLAAAVVLQPTLLAINAVFHPEVEMNAESMLAGAAENPDSWYVVHLVAAFGALLGVPAAFGMRRLVSRSRTLAGTALVAAVIAGVVLSTAFVAEASVLRLAATAELGDAEATKLADAYIDTPEFFAVGPGVLAAAIAGLLFAIALLRDRVVPRWMPLTMLVGTVLTNLGGPGTPFAPVGFGLVAVAAIGLAPRVARISTRAASRPVSG